MIRSNMISCRFVETTSVTALVIACLSFPFCLSSSSTYSSFDKYVSYNLITSSNNERSVDLINTRQWWVRMTKRWMFHFPTINRHGKHPFICYWRKRSERMKITNHLSNFIRCNLVLLADVLNNTLRPLVKISS
jgi:hypothetical protein